ncbi:hypothetical protein SCG7086_AA_00450 [Chlamydiales bacterium SCGC AG-110-P3]|nr:hypothetical protein SCG7086_AA_00450 [Chlamydiales bacterium SCGC AG-110-P3]
MMRLPMFVATMVGLAVTALAPACTYAFEQKPWYGYAFELESRPIVYYSSYTKIDTAIGSVRRPSNDIFATVALGAAVFQRWHVEAEIHLVHTSAHDISVGHTAVAARYLWFDDVIGDPLSLTTGVAVIVPVGEPDLSLRYHGNVGTEGHIAIGKELSCGMMWAWRWWMLAGLGIADEGDPWARGRIALEKNNYDCWHVELFAEAFAGLGNQNLRLTTPFQGYNKIAHRSVDMGAAYTCYLEWLCVDVTASYQYRIYSENAPEAVHTAMLAFRIPISL